MDDNHEKRVIHITGIESKDGRITLLDSQNDKTLKYAFWMNKQNKEPTTAFVQFTKLGLSIGKAVEAEVKEEERTFVNDKGKSVTYTARTIMYFYTDDPSPGAPKSKSGRTDDFIVPVSQKEFNKTVNDIREAFKVLAQKVKELEDRPNIVYPKE